MKALTLLPTKIKKDYHIIRRKDRIAVHRPAYVNIDFDESFSVDSNEITCHISNSKVNVTLWRNQHFMHVAIFS